MHRTALPRIHPGWCCSKVISIGWKLREAFGVRRLVAALAINANNRQRKRERAQRTLRACFKIPCGSVFAEKAGWRGATTEHTRQGSVTEEQQSQRTFSAKTLRAAGLLSAACVDSAITARCGDAPASPPWPQPKSLAAGPHAILKQAPSHRVCIKERPINSLRRREEYSVKSNDVCVACWHIFFRFYHSDERRNRFGKLLALPSGVLDQRLVAMSVTFIEAGRLCCTGALKPDCASMSEYSATV